MSVSYGLPVQTPDDVVSLLSELLTQQLLSLFQYITDAEETMDMIGKATVPGAFLVDLVPRCERNSHCVVKSRMELITSC